MEALCLHFVISIEFLVFIVLHVFIIHQYIYDKYLCDLIVSECPAFFSLSCQLCSCFPIVTSRSNVFVFLNVMKEQDIIVSSYHYNAITGLLTIS